MAAPPANWRQTSAAKLFFEVFFQALHSRMDELHIRADGLPPAHADGGLLDELLRHGLKLLSSD
jgi:hypothetical protein